MSSLQPPPAATPFSYAAAAATPTPRPPEEPYRKPAPPPPAGPPDVSSRCTSETSPSASVLEYVSTSTTVTPSPPTAMISGHTDLPQDLFDKHYIPQLATAFETGANFILGDAKGVDEMALSWLLTRLDTDSRSRVTVYCSRAYNVPKLEALGVNVIPDDSDTKRGGRAKARGRDPGNPNASRQRHLDRDASMTAASDFDILYVRTDEEARVFYGGRWRRRVSATEMNRDRRVRKMQDSSGPTPMDIE